MTWTAPHSGLGDRLCALVPVCVDAIVRGCATINVVWPPPPKSSAYPAHRQEDLLPKNLHQCLSLPKMVRLGDSCVETSVETGSNGAIDLGWLFTHRGGTLTESAFNLVVDDIRRQFLFVPDILAIVDDFGTFAAVHIRRTDKVQSNPGCTTQIRCDQLQKLDELTRDCIRGLFDAGLRAFLVCADDNEAAAQYSDFIRALGAEVLALPEMEKWRTTYYDLAAMSRARVILQSQASSAFSHFARFLGGNDLINVTRDGRAPDSARSYDWKRAETWGTGTANLCRAVKP
jgi:hypothetical protein